MIEFELASILSVVTIYQRYFLLLLPDFMFMLKMLESDWLDNGTWTIYTFPYRRSGPFIRLSIKIKVKDFWDDGRKPIDRAS